MWVKWRHKFSYGEDSEFSYMELSDRTSEEGIKDEIIELATEYEWSEHYRGIDYEVINHPPVDIIEKYIRKAKREVKGLKQQIADWEALINNIKEE